MLLVIYDLTSYQRINFIYGNTNIILFLSREFLFVQNIPTPSEIISRHIFLRIQCTINAVDIDSQKIKALHSDATRPIKISV